MGKSNNQFNINGKIGTLVFYKVDDEWYVRVEKGKMTDEQKQKESFRPAMRTLELASRGAAFGKLLFKGISKKYNCDRHWYTRMKGYMHGIVKMDKLNDWDDMTIQPENVHHISGIVANTLFPIPLRKDLESTSFQKKGKKLIARIPPLSNPFSPADVSHWSLWINLKTIVAGKKDIRILNSVETIPVPVESIIKTDYSFDLPVKKANEHLIATIGIWSFKDGIRSVDKRFNGVVFQEIRI